ncbi:type V CRISPR-associated protein Cas4 [Candidatus Peribacteria bacterium RIFCSPLOWO2_01_FULL_51_18]|nr:MAG: type V CRISPR-associated protein Cas4 [Candidatus Peribacteria bacterium RIFCSPLOWO2_01_FULL_51_18]
MYFHNLYGAFDVSVYHHRPQTEGRIRHRNIDVQRYSSSKRYLQGLSVASASLGICGKIDILDTETATLIERKTKIRHIYDGYLFQVYAQYFCLTEMGHDVRRIALHSLADNVRREIPLPDDGWEKKMRELIGAIRTFDPNTQGFTQNPEKCRACIYANLCDSSAV